MPLLCPNPTKRALSFFSFFLLLVVVVAAAAVGKKSAEASAIRRRRKEATRRGAAGCCNVPGGNPLFLLRSSCNTSTPWPAHGRKTRFSYPAKKAACLLAGEEATAASRVPALAFAATTATATRPAAATPGAALDSYVA